MDAEIHAVDTERRDSEGHHLRVRARPVEAVIKKNEDGLPLGEVRERLHVEVRATSCEASTQSTLTVRLYAEDLQHLFEVARSADLISLPD